MSVHLTVLSEEDTIWVDWLRVPVDLRRESFGLGWVFSGPHRTQDASGIRQRVPKAWADEHGIAEAAPPVECPTCHRPLDPSP